MDRGDDGKYLFDGKGNCTSFFNYLIKLRWVILQDCAVMIGKKKRQHFIFEHMSELFESDIFKDYTV